MIDNQQQPEAQASQPRHEPAYTRRPRSDRAEGFKSALSTIAILLVAPLVAVFLTMFVFQSYQVDGQSMETTLFNNDRLIVWKMPKTWARITRHPYIPNRGDIIVFTEPKLGQFGQDPSKQLIKRVIALPGERVVVQNNVLTVYNKEHPNGFIPDQELPYGNVIKETSMDGSWTVGPDQLFVSGDNRGNSLDSRSFGPINVHNIVGKLAVRVLPLNEIKKF